MFQIFNKNTGVKSQGFPELTLITVLMVTISYISYY